jgi:hypothetical protein
MENNQQEIPLDCLIYIANNFSISVDEIIYYGEKVLRQEVQVINEPLLQKVKLLDELDDLQRNSIYVLIDTAIANKRLKEALSNAMSI